MKRHAQSNALNNNSLTIFYKWPSQHNPFSTPLYYFKLKKKHFICSLWENTCRQWKEDNITKTTKEAIIALQWWCHTRRGTLRFLIFSVVWPPCWPSSPSLFSSSLVPTGGSLARLRVISRPEMMKNPKVTLTRTRPQSCQRSFSSSWQETSNPRTWLRRRTGLRKAVLAVIIRKRLVVVRWCGRALELENRVIITDSELCGR